MAVPLKPWNRRSWLPYFDTASAVAKLGLNAGNAFGGNMDQVIAFMEQVNKQFVIGGATAQEQSNAMIQLTQAMAAGAHFAEALSDVLDEYSYSGRCAGYRKSH